MLWSPMSEVEEAGRWSVADHCGPSRQRQSATARLNFNTSAEEEPGGDISLANRRDEGFILARQISSPRLSDQSPITNNQRHSLGRKVLGLLRILQVLSSYSSILFFRIYFITLYIPECVKCEVTIPRIYSGIPNQ